MFTGCKLLTIGKQLPTFSHSVRGCEPPASEVEGECITIALHGPQVPFLIYNIYFICRKKIEHLSIIKIIKRSIRFAYLFSHRCD